MFSKKLTSHGHTLLPHNISETSPETNPNLCLTPEVQSSKPKEDFKKVKNNKPRTSYIKTANIVYNLNKINIQNIFLLENKRNIIMDGKFTKIIYSDDITTMNGIFIYIPFTFDNIRTNQDVVGRKHANLGNISEGSEMRSIGAPTQYDGDAKQRRHIDLSVLNKLYEDGCGRMESGSMPTTNGGVKTSSVATTFEDKNENTSCLPFGGMWKDEVRTHAEILRRCEAPEQYDIFKDLICLEQHILDYYKHVFHCSKKTITILKSQLLAKGRKCEASERNSGDIINPYTHNFICLRSFASSPHFLMTNASSTPSLILKISGIWEDCESIGLTYKFITS